MVDHTIHGAATPTHGALGNAFGALPARVLSGVACLALFAMMIVTFVDVVGRYFFASPLPAGYELVSLIMPLIIFCALPAVNLRGGHVTIDLLDNLIPAGVRRLQHRVVSLASAAVLGVITWRLAVLSFSHHEFDAVTDELFLPLWPFSAVTCALAAVATSTMLVAALGPPPAAGQPGVDAHASRA